MVDQHKSLLWLWVLAIDLDLSASKVLILAAKQFLAWLHVQVKSREMSCAMDTSSRGVLQLSCKKKVILHVERQGFMTPISFSKALPIPNEDRIKHLLGQNAWTSQKNELACFYPRLASKSETGKIGLINLGNTCYMNSIIQSLFMASEWVFAPLLPFRTALGLLITQALCFPC